MDHDTSVEIIKLNGEIALLDGKLLVLQKAMDTLRDTQVAQAKQHAEDITSLSKLVGHAGQFTGEAKVRIDVLVERVDELERAAAAKPQTPPPLQQ